MTSRTDDADAAGNDEFATAKAINEQAIEKVARNGGEVEEAKKEEREATSDAKAREELGIVIVDDEGACALITKLHEEAKTQALEERSLAECELGLLDRPDCVVLALKGDLGHHLSVFCMCVGVSRIFLVGMEFAGDGPSKLILVFLYEPSNVSR